MALLLNFLLTWPFYFIFCPHWQRIPLFLLANFTIQVHQFNHEDENNVCFFKKYISCDGECQ